MRPSEVAQRLKLLVAGEFIEIPCPPSVPSYRSAVANLCGVIHFAVRKSIDGLTLRFYRTGDWGTFWNGKETAEAVAIAHSLPVIWHNIAARIAKRPPIYWFGFLGGSLGPSLHRKKAKKLVWPCSFRGCPFPKGSGELCFRHAHFEELAYLMEGRLDLNDIFPSEKVQRPELSVQHGYELDSYDFMFEYRGRKEWDLSRSGGKQQFNGAPKSGHTGIIGKGEMRPVGGCGGSRTSLFNKRGRKSKGLLPAVSESLRCAPTRPDLDQSHCQAE